MEHAERASVPARRTGMPGRGDGCVKSNTCRNAVRFRPSTARLPFDVSLQPAQGIVPESRDSIEVQARVGKPLRLDLPDALASAPVPPDQTGPGKDVQVFRDRLARHRGLRAQASDRFRPARGEPDEEFETRLVPE